MSLLITTTNMPVSIIRLEKKKYLKSEMYGYQPLEPNGWNTFIKNKAKEAVSKINRIILLFSYKYTGILVFIVTFLIQKRRQQRYIILSKITTTEILSIVYMAMQHYI